MSTSRQDPDYPVDDSIRSALAIMTAFCTPDEVDEELVEHALELALDRTDHTELVRYLGHLLNLAVTLAAQARGQERVELVQQMAAETNRSIEDNPE